MSLARKISNYKYQHTARGCVLHYSPRSLSIQTTNRCTLNCDMCHAHSTKIPNNPFHYQGGKDIDFATFKRFVDRYRAALSVSLIGTGEPLLNKDFFDMALYANQQHQMEVKTVTNGTTLHIQNNIDKLLSSGISSIGISLNGHNPEEFHRMTGNSESTYSLILSSIKELIAKRNEFTSKSSLPLISLSFILDQANYRYAPAMIRLAESLGVNKVNLSNFLSSPVPGFTAQERSLYADNSDIVKILSISRHISRKIKISLPTLLVRDSTQRYCQTYFHLLRTDGNSNIGGCATMLLNLANNGKFTDRNAWNNLHFRTMRAIFLDPEYPLPAPCYVCPSNSKPTVW